MKKIIILILCIAFALLLLSCNNDEQLTGGGLSRDRVPNQNTVIDSAVSFSDYNGLQFVLRGVERVGYADTLNIEFVNQTDFTVTYGKAYDIQRLDGSEWVSVICGDMEIIEIGCVLAPHSAANESYSTDPFDITSEGRYRLIIDAYVQLSDTDVRHSSVGIEFYAAEQAEKNENASEQIDLQFIEDSIKVNSSSSDVSVIFDRIEYREPSFSSLPHYYVIYASVINSSDTQLEAYIPYDIERYEYGRWVSVCSADIDYTELWKTVEPGESLTRAFSADGFDLSLAGRYRIVSYCTFAADAAAQRVQLTVKFEIP